MANKESFYITEPHWPESNPIVIQFRIDLILKKACTVSGEEYFSLLNQYRMKAEMYNTIVGFKAYDILYSPKKEDWL